MRAVSRGINNVEELERVEKEEAERAALALALSNPAYSSTEDLLSPSFIESWD